jgi:hypothetical protein
MKRFIFVECYADKYFFGKLIQDETLINKVAGKDELINTIINNRKNIFTIAIIDKDKTELKDKFGKSREHKNIKIEYGYIYENEIEVFKIEERPLFIIQISPIEFEKWINEFVKNNGKKIEDFEFASLEDFEENHCKKHLDKLKEDEKFKKVMKFVLDNYVVTDNSINRLKQTLTYLIEKNYKTDIKKLKEILN